MGLKKWLKDREVEKEVDSTIISAVGYLRRAEACKDKNDRKGIASLGINRLSVEIGMYPEQPLLYYGRGKLFTYVGDYENARKDFERIPLDDEKVIMAAKKRGFDLRKKVIAELAFLDYSLGDYDEAAKNFLKTRVENIPEEFLQSPELIHFGKGCIFDVNKRPEDAKKEFLEVLKISPDLDSEFLQKFSWFPSKDNFFLNLSLNEYKATNNTADAIKYCEKALEINPSNEKAKIFLDVLKKQQPPAV
jgi:tetratricopeptide (TPR) repeat protein